MKLTINKRILKAGTVIEVTWDCGKCDSPRLVMHTGKRESVLAVPPTGSKRFKIKSSKGEHWIGLKAVDYGKELLVKRRFFVYGTNNETDSFEYMDRRDNFFTRIKTNVLRWWNMFTPEKKRLYLIMLSLLAYQFVAALWPEVGRVMFYCIIFWLFWMIAKK